MIYKVWYHYPGQVGNWIFHSYLRTYGEACVAAMELFEQGVTAYIEEQEDERSSLGR
jgi:hypothetical protein